MVVVPGVARDRITSAKAGFVTTARTRTPAGTVAGPWTWQQGAFRNGRGVGGVGASAAEPLAGRIVVLFQVVDVVFVAVHAYAALTLVGASHHPVRVSAAT